MDVHAHALKYIGKLVTKTYFQYQSAMKKADTVNAKILKDRLETVKYIREVLRTANLFVRDQAARHISAEVEKDGNSEGSKPEV